MPRFRLDQALACDECVLHEAPQDETTDANTLLHSIGMDSTPVLIPWLAEPQLKERLTMIQRLCPGALRRRAGFVGASILMVGCAANPPQRPANNIRSHELKGTVVLIVLVGTDGMPSNFSVDPATHASPELVKAASDAAMKMRFNPHPANGKPIVGYVRIPFLFDGDNKTQAPNTDQP